MPPEFFHGKSVFDLGAGTGEHTIQLAEWGAECTLVDLNPEANDGARRVFGRYCPEAPVQYWAGSLFDLDIELIRRKFDIGHSRGVFSHVADRELAFSILPGAVKPHGYVIHGDRNQAGGFQEQLQLWATYRLGDGSEQSIVEIAEALFSADIARSQAAVPRTREAIIYDRWAIRQQDDPSVSEVFEMFARNGLEYVISWPRIDFMGRGSSTDSDTANPKATLEGAMQTELLWMILNGGEEENLRDTITAPTDLLPTLASLTERFRNLKISSVIDLEAATAELRDASQLAGEWLHVGSPTAVRLRTFLAEVSAFIDAVTSEVDVSSLQRQIESQKVLFRGFTGVRHVDYVAYKPKLA